MNAGEAVALVAGPLVVAGLVAVWLVRRYRQGTDGSWPPPNRAGRIHNEGSGDAGAALVGAHLYAGGRHDDGDGGGDGADGGGGGADGGGGGD
jgi:hypothetical protein